MENLKKSRGKLIKKAAFISALEEIEGNENFLAEKKMDKPPEKCPRCKSENSGNRFFCNFCGERYSKDRLDVGGSLVEVGELNRVHGSLLKGITGSVSFLALVNGLAKGLDEFHQECKLG